MLKMVDGQESKAFENIPLALKLHEASYKMDVCVLKFIYASIAWIRLSGHQQNDLSAILGEVHHAKQ